MAKTNGAIIRDTVRDGHLLSDFAYHRDIAILLFRAYWTGNRDFAARWAIEFIRDHQGLKNGEGFISDSTNT